MQVLFIYSFFPKKKKNQEIQPSPSRLPVLCGHRQYMRLQRFLPSDLVKPPSKNFFRESYPWGTERFMDKAERHCIIHAAENWKGPKCSATRKWLEQMATAWWWQWIVIMLRKKWKMKQKCRTFNRMHRLQPVLFLCICGSVWSQRKEMGRKCSGISRWRHSCTCGACRFR